MKRAIVVGASSGIGSELAKILAKDGYKVGIAARRTHLLEELISTSPSSYLIKTIDATNVDESSKNLSELVEELGGLELLVLSSGTGELNEDLDFQIDKGVLDLNVSGFTNIADWTFNLFLKQGFGHFVAITSIAGLRGGRQAPSYNASKAFQISYLQGLRQKARNKNLPVFITDVRPGFVDTKMAKGEGKFWVMPVERVAHQIYNAIRGRRKVAYITKRWGFMARILKMVPSFIYDRM